MLDEPGLGVSLAEWWQVAEKILPDVNTKILAHEAMKLRMLCRT